MRLKILPPCITNASVVPPNGEFPELAMRFYTLKSKADGMVIQSINDQGVVLDQLVISVGPTDGKLSSSRRTRPLKLDVDTKKDV